jgi:hypothetical protein
MPEIPHAPLADALEKQIGDRRLVSAVFLSYKFEPSFFEQEVLPVLFDVSFSHAAARRIAKYEIPAPELIESVFFLVKNWVHLAFLRVAHGSRAKWNSRSRESKNVCGVGHSSNRLLYNVVLMVMGVSSFERIRELPIFFFSRNGVSPLSFNLNHSLAPWN